MKSIHILFDWIHEYFNRTVLYFHLVMIIIAIAGHENKSKASHWHTLL